MLDSTWLDYDGQNGATMNNVSDLSKNGRTMLGEESKWLVLLELVKDRSLSL